MKTIKLLICSFFILSSSYGQSGEQIRTFILQRGVAYVILAVNPSYIAGHGLGQVMDRNLGTMAKHWRDTRIAIENVDNNYTDYGNAHLAVPFSFVKYEADRQRLLRYFKDMEYFEREFQKTYDTDEKVEFIKAILLKQKQINDLFIQYGKEPYFVDNDTISKSTFTSIDGVYSTTFNEMTIRIQNGSITGDYKYKDGVLRGCTLNGLHLEGKWIQNNAEGKFYFDFYPDFTGFEGFWGLNDEHPTNVWDGTRM